MPGMVVPHFFQLWWYTSQLSQLTQWCSTRFHRSRHCRGTLDPLAPSYGMSWTTESSQPCWRHTSDQSKKRESSKEYVVNAGHRLQTQVLRRGPTSVWRLPRCHLAKINLLCFSVPSFSQTVNLEIRSHQLSTFRKAHHIACFPHMPSRTNHTNRNRARIYLHEWIIHFY